MITASDRAGVRVSTRENLHGRGIKYIVELRRSFPIVCVFRLMEIFDFPVAKKKNRGMINGRIQEKTRVRFNARVSTSKRGAA